MLRGMQHKAADQSEQVMGKWLSWFLVLVAGIGFGSLRSNAADTGVSAGENEIRLRQDSNSQLTSPPPDKSLWAGDVGDGFQRGAHELGLTAGFGLGMAAFGSSQAHDLALGTLNYGWMLTGVLGEDHWYRGNVELLGQVFGGEQVNPRRAWVAEGAALLRYNFATGTPCVPFAQLGAGAGGTDIGGPDLSTTFEFNVQGGLGVHYFFRRNAALTFQYRLLHLSNARIRSPNLGVNVNMFEAGVSWFF